MKYGVTETGFKRKEFSEIRESIASFINTQSSGSVITDSNSLAGIITDAVSREINPTWLAAAASYNAHYISTSSNISLDYAARNKGLVRLEAVATKVTVELTGINNTNIQAGSEVIAPGINTIFSLSGDVTLSNASCIAIILDIPDITKNNFSLIINNNEVSYNLQLGDTKLEILSGLKTEIDNLGLDISVDISSNNLNITTNDTENKLTVYIVENISILTVTDEGIFIAKDKGFISVPTGAITTIQTPIFGWNSATNKLPGMVGRNRETDEEFRTRAENSDSVTGGGTVEAIRSRLLNTNGVISAKVIDNREDVEVNGLPPHSFSALVFGGEDQDIASVIWLSGGAGIKTFGNTQVVTIDSEGNPQIINFSRPIPLYIYVNITLQKDETKYPLDGDITIKTKVVDLINKSGIGNDVIYQSLYQAIYSIPGIINASVEIGGTLIELDIPNLLSQNIALSSSQVATTDITKISIV